MNKRYASLAGIAVIILFILGALFLMGWGCGKLFCWEWEVVKQRKGCYEIHGKDQLGIFGNIDKKVIYVRGLFGLGGWIDRNGNYISEGAKQAIRRDENEEYLKQRFEEID